MKKDDVHLTMRRVTDRLREEKIPYAILGGMAAALQTTSPPTTVIRVFVANSDDDA